MTDEQRAAIDYVIQADSVRRRARDRPSQKALDGMKQIIIEWGKLKELHGEDVQSLNNLEDK